MLVDFYPLKFASSFGLLKEKTISAITHSIRARALWRALASATRIISALKLLLRRGKRDTGIVTRILVIKLDAIGDMVLASPVFRELVRAFPNARVTLVARPATVALMEMCPYVERIIKFNPHSSGNGSCREWDRFRATLLGLELSRGSFDIAVLPRWDYEFYNGYYLLVGAGASRTALHARTCATVSESWLSRLETRGATVVRTSSKEHEIIRNLRLVEELGGSFRSNKLELWLSEADRTAAREWMQLKIIAAEGLIIAFGIGASIISKCWPERMFAEVARRLITRYSAKILLIGAGQEDQRRADAILSGLDQCKAVSAVGALSVRETAALLKRCQLFIGNDSAPMHLAAAAGIPVVAIWGLPENEDPDENFSATRFAPWGVPHMILRPPATPRKSVENDWEALDMRAITVDDVYNAAVDFIEKYTDNRTSVIALAD